MARVVVFSELNSFTSTLPTDIPHSGQLKKTSSILLTPVYSRWLWNRNSIEMYDSKRLMFASVLSVRSSLAHAAPSRWDRVGVWLSNRTLVPGVLQ